MALEDAVMLAACLRRAGPGNEPAALREYAFRRQPRTARMLESSRVNLRNSQTSDPVQVRARNGYYRGLERLSPAGPPMQEWLLAHDPVAAAVRSPAEFEQDLTVAGEPDAAAAGAAGLRPVADRADGRAPGGGLARRAPGLRGVPARPPAPGQPERAEQADRRDQLRRDARPASRAPVAGCRPGGSAPARRRLLDGLGRAGGAAGRAAGGGRRRLVAGARLPARARAPVPGRAARRPRRLPLAGPRVPAGPDPGQRRVRGRRAGPQPRAGAARLRPAGRQDAAGIHVVSPFCDLALTAENLGPRRRLRSVAQPDRADPAGRLLHPRRRPGPGPGVARRARTCPACRRCSSRRPSPRRCSPARSGWPTRRAGPASRSRSARSPTASIRSSCSISCQKPTARWPSSPRSRGRCARAKAADRRMVAIDASAIDRQGDGDDEGGTEVAERLRAESDRDDGHRQADVGEHEVRGDDLTAGLRPGRAGWRWPGCP